MNIKISIYYGEVLQESFTREVATFTKENVAYAMSTPPCESWSTEDFLDNLRETPEGFTWDAEKTGRAYNMTHATIVRGTIMSIDLKKELKELLQKHNATIQFERVDCSDLHGVYDERIEIVVREDPKCWHETVVFSKGGCTLSEGDL